MSTPKDLELTYKSQNFVLAPEQSMTFGRAADLQVDDNQYMHRVVGTFVNRSNQWNLMNSGSKISISVRNLDVGSQVTLEPGAEHVLENGESIISFTAGPTNYEISLHLEGAEEPSQDELGTISYTSDLPEAPPLPAAGSAPQPPPPGAPQAPDLTPRALVPGAGDDVPYADVGQRVPGHLLDSLIALVSFAPAIVLFNIFGPDDSYLKDDDPGSLFALFLLAVFIAPSLYLFVLLPAWNGATIGKRMTGFAIVDQNTFDKPSIGQSFGRYVGYFVNGLCCGILWFYTIYTVANHPRRQGLHDSMGSAVVVPSEFVGEDVAPNWSNWRWF